MRVRGGRAAVVTMALATVVVATACEEPPGKEVAGGAGGYCDALRAYADLAANADISVQVSGAQSEGDVDRAVAEAKRRVQETVDGGLRLANRLRDEAPQTLDADVDLATAPDIRYFEAMRAKGYDPFALVGDAALAVSSEEKRAFARVDEAARRDCDTAFRSAAAEAVSGGQGVGVPGGSQGGSGPSGPSSPAGPVAPTPPTEAPVRTAPPRPDPTGPPEPTAPPDPAPGT